MAPTKMKLRRRDTGAGGGGPGGGGAGGGGEQEETSKTPSSRSVSAEASPDSKCPICLDRFNNMSYLDRCLHRFCFRCIQEWSNSKAECPLCKQPFSSIFHSVRAQDDFKEFTLRPPAPGENGMVTIATTEAAAAALVTARAGGNHGERRRLRRGGGGGQGRGGRERRYLGRQVREMAFLSSPPLPPPPPLHPPLLPRPEDGGMAGAALMGEDEEEDPGVIFQGLTGSAAPPPHDRGVQRLAVRLAARRRAQRDGRPARQLRPRETLAFRRALYRCGVRVRGSLAAGERPRDITASFYLRNPAALQRIHPWLQRELTVLYGAHGSLVNIVQRIITSRITRHDMAGGGSAIQDELRPFLLARTDHFLHELICFARSPLSMEAYDQLAVYDPQSHLGRMTSSSSDTDDSVIAISEEEEEEEGGSEGERERRPVSGAESSTLSQSAWDDETPGPSYSTAEPSHLPAPLPASPGERDPGPAEGSQHQEMTGGARGEEEGEEEGVDECMIVGFVKPMAERTPELVQLSSDSSEQEDEQKKKEEERTEEEKKPAFSLPALPPLCMDIPPLSIPPPSPPKHTDPERRGLVGERESEGGERSRHCPPVEGRRECPWPGASGSRSRSRQRSEGRSGNVRSDRSRSSERRRSAPMAAPPQNDDSSRERHRRRREREREKRRRRRGRERDSLSQPYCRDSYRHHEPWKEGGGGKDTGSERIPYEPTRSRCSHNGILSSPEYSVLAHSPLHSQSLSQSSKQGRESPKEHRHSCSSDSLSSFSSTSHLSADGQTSRRSDKPGGKRKYKTRHLEDPSWEPPSSTCRQKGRDGGRDGGKAGAETSPRPRNSRTRREESETRRPRSRSPSVEIVYDGRAERGASPLRHQRDRKHRRKQRHSRRHSPVIITIDSDSDRTPHTTRPDDNHPLDLTDHDALAFSDRDFPEPGHPPGDHSLDMGIDISDLAVDILDRSLTALDHSSGNGLRDLVVHKMDVARAVDDCVDDVTVNAKNPVLNRSSAGHTVNRNTIADDIGHVHTQVGNGDPVVPTSVTSDSRLLAAILRELEHIPLPKPDPCTTSCPDRSATTSDSRDRPPVEAAKTSGSSGRSEEGTITNIPPDTRCVNPASVLPSDCPSIRSPTHVFPIGLCHRLANPGSPKGPCPCSANPGSPIGPNHRSANPSSSIGPNHRSANPGSPIGPNHRSANPGSSIGPYHRSANPGSPIGPYHRSANPGSPIGPYHRSANPASLLTYNTSAVPSIQHVSNCLLSEHLPIATSLARHHSPASPPPSIGLHHHANTPPSSIGLQHHANTPPLSIGLHHHANTFPPSIGLHQCATNPLPSISLHHHSTNPPSSICLRHNSTRPPSSIGLHPHATSLPPSMQNSSGAVSSTLNLGNYCGTQVSPRNHCSGTDPVFPSQENTNSGSHVAPRSDSVAWSSGTGLHFANKSSLSSIKGCSNSPVSARDDCSNSPGSAREDCSNSPVSAGVDCSNSPVLAREDCSNSPVSAREDCSNSPVSARGDCSNSPVSARGDCSNSPLSSREDGSNSPESVTEKCGNSPLSVTEECGNSLVSVTEECGNSPLSVTEECGNSPVSVTEESPVV